MFRSQITLITPPPPAPPAAPDLTLAEIKTPLQFFVTLGGNR